MKILLNFMLKNEKEKFVRFFDDKSILLEEDYKFDKFGNATQEDGSSNSVALLLTLLAPTLFAFGVFAFDKN